MSVNGSIFPPNGKRMALLKKLWPGWLHHSDILRQLNDIPEGGMVKIGTARIVAQKLGVRRPFTRGRHSREVAMRAAGTWLE